MSDSRDSNTRLTQRQLKKRKIKKRILFILIPIILIFIAIAAYAGFLYIKANSAANDAFKDDGRNKSSLRDAEVDPKFDNVSILIMGIDSSEKRGDDDKARTDSLMVATLNQKKKSVKLLSVPRDSYAYIPDVGYSTKINHAHAFGGTTGAIETVENLFDIPIDYYVKVNFNAFMDVIEELNGIEIDVPFEFKEQDSKDRADKIHLYPGEQTLNGEEALAFTRTRKADNDIERGKRQQVVIESIIDRATSLNSIMKYDNIIDAVGKNMSTNLTFGDIKSLVKYGISGKPEIDTLTLDGRDYQPANAYYWQISDVGLEETRHKLQKHLELPLTDSINNIETFQKEPFQPEQTPEDDYQ